MKFFSAMAMVLALGVGVTAMDAEAARRIGGGKSVGMQRQATTPDKAPTATPAQTPGTPASAAAAAPAAATAAAGTAAAASKRSWMGPLAGIAAGLGLAALASHFGFGDELASMLLIGLAVMAVLAVVGLIMRKRAAAQAGGNGRTAFAGAGAGAPGSRPYEVAMPSPASAPAGGSMIGANLAAAPTGNRIPADFDVASFVRNAKVQFIRLQAANDAGNLDDIREFTTPEMFAEIQMDMSDRAGAAQSTEVLQLEADVIEVVEDTQRYVVSVRFTGSIREEAQAPAEAFEELWHLVKPRQGSGGWVLAGIQQGR